QSAIRLGMAVRAADRFSSVEQLQNALNGQSTTWVPTTPEENTVSFRPTQSSPKKRMPLTTAAILILSLSFFILAAVLFYGILQKNSETAISPVASAAPSVDKSSNTANNETVSSTPPSAPAGIASATPTPVPTPAPTPTPVPKPDRQKDTVLLEEAVYLCLSDYVNSINTGNTSNVSAYIDIDAQTYYNESVKNIQRLYQQGIREELLSYDIVKISWLDDDRCNLTQHSVIRVYYPSGETKDVDETYTYLLRRKQNRFVYVKMYE
ncbi:TcaA NTF2-like domain-containing protein, partial [Ructibacterium gallinarum]|nr:hypothetical protein [Ructibacterium gallinarum]